LIIAVLGAACDQQAARPRSFEYFKEDGLAREGALVRCNQDRAATENDIECANARRAAVAVAAQVEASRRGERAAESERKLAALRDRVGREDLALQEAEAAARAAADAAYEAQWRDLKDEKDAAGAVPAEPTARPHSFGAPLGTMLPSMRDEAAFSLESLSQVPARPELALAALSPPVAEIGKPQVQIEQSAMTPSAFGSDTTLRR
jgi:hypothetical protein